MNKTLKLWEVIKLITEDNSIEINHEDGTVLWHGDKLCMQDDCGHQFHLELNGYTVRKKKVKAWKWFCLVADDMRLVTVVPSYLPPKTRHNQKSEWQKVDGSEVEIDELMAP